MVELLSRTKAIPELTSPQGRKFAVIQHFMHPNLYTIAYAEGQGIPGPVPEELRESLYTKVALAEATLIKYLVGAWDFHDQCVEDAKIKARTKAA